MPKPHPQQPSFDEDQAIQDNPDLQKLLEWYPDRHDAILAAYHRRNPHPGCTCPWQHRRKGRCCILLRTHAPANSHRRRTPSRRGQYREQL